MVKVNAVNGDDVIAAECWHKQANASSDDVTRADMAEMMTSADRVLACGSVWRRVTKSGGTWRRVPVTPRIIVAHGGAWKVRWRRYFTERQIREITFRWCNLWSDRRSGSGGGGKTVVFDVLKSRWRQWCCSQQRLQMTPKKTRLLKSDTPKD